MTYVSNRAWRHSNFSLASLRASYSYNCTISLLLPLDTPLSFARRASDFVYFILLTTLKMCDFVPLPIICFQCGTYGCPNRQMSSPSNRRVVIRTPATAKLSAPPLDSSLLWEWPYVSVFTSPAHRPLILIDLLLASFNPVLLLRDRRRKEVSESGSLVVHPLTK